MSVFDKLGASVKAAARRLPFSSYGGYGYGMSGMDGMSGGYLPGISLNGSGYMGSQVPGTQYDYKSAAGVLWQNPSAAACFVALTKAFAQARPYLEQHNGKEWERVDSHPLTDLIQRPNKFYSGEKLFGVTLISTMANEAAFWRFERNGASEVAEIWFEPPVGHGATGIAPAWDSTEFIKEYYYFVDGKRQSKPISIEDVVYFRNGLNPSNARLPWSPLDLGIREIATLNGASTFTGALLRNGAVPSGMLSLEGSALASGTPPTPLQAEEMKAKINANFKGDGVGDIFVSSQPWKFSKFGYSPADLNIDSIRQWPQGQICALLGTPEIVALLPTGGAPTYENLDATMKWWWDNTIIPMEDSFADEIETQMFPAFGLDSNEFRLVWDRSQVPALQEDQVAKSTMITGSYTGGVIDLFKAQTDMGIPDVPEEYKGRFHPSATAGDPQAAPVTPDEKAGQDRLNKATKAWEESDHPRDDDGKFGSGGGGKRTIKQIHSDVYDAVRKHLSNGGTIQIPGNPPKIVKAGAINHFSLSSGGKMYAGQGKSRGALTLETVRSIGAQAGHNVPFHTIDYGVSEEPAESEHTNSTAAIDKESFREDGISRLIKAGVSDVFDEIETMTGRSSSDVPSLAVSLIADIHDAKEGKVSSEQARTTQAETQKLSRAIINDDKLEGRDRADAMENARLISDLAQSLVDTTVRVKVQGSAKKSLEDYIMDNETKADDTPELPPLSPDMNGMEFTDSEREALEMTDNDAAKLLAFAVATPAQRILLKAKVIDNVG